MKKLFLLQILTMMLMTGELMYGASKGHRPNVKMTEKERAETRDWVDLLVIDPGAVNIHSDNSILSAYRMRFEKDPFWMNHNQAEILKMVAEARAAGRDRRVVSSRRDVRAVQVDEELAGNPDVVFNVIEVVRLATSDITPQEEQRQIAILDREMDPQVVQATQNLERVQKSVEEQITKSRNQVTQELDSIELAKSKALSSGVSTMAFKKQEQDLIDAYYAQENQLKGQIEHAERQLDYAKKRAREGAKRLSDQQFNQIRQYVARKLQEKNKPTDEKKFGEEIFVGIIKDVFHLKFPPQNEPDDVDTWQKHNPGRKDVTDIVVNLDEIGREIIKPMFDGYYALQVVEFVAEMGSFAFDRGVIDEDGNPRHDVEEY